MKHILCAILLVTGILHLQGQTTITGKITNARNETIPSASVKIGESGLGVHADSLGRYTLITNGKGKKTLEISSVGYDVKKLIVILADSVLHLDVVMNDKSKQLGEVVIVSAGSFEASDKAKGASLTPMDAVTVAGSGADIANSLRSLPGTQRIGESEGLFVRGGTNDEAKQFIDGALLPNPNYSSVPGILQPARVNPFLFKGILFSTGGYSALYGEALSSALILETVDLPDKSSASMSIFPSNQSLGFQHLAKNNKSSYGISGGYSNAHWYNQLIPQKPGYFHGPEYFTGDANFRIKTSKTGMLKFYTNYGYNNVGMRNPDIDSADLLSSFQVKGQNWYANLSYRESLNNNWRIDAVTAYNYDKENIQNQLVDQQHTKLLLPNFPFTAKNNSNYSTTNYVQGRIVLSKQLSKGQTIRLGGEYTNTRDRLTTTDSSEERDYSINDNFIAAFTEGDIYIKRNIAAKIGVRAEYSSYLDKINIAPRISLAYKFNDGGQINMAYGLFYQKPGNEFLFQNDNLNYARAAHYIINYQKKASNRLFRIEAFYKKYKNLVSTGTITGNKGDGYARGFELFFRDKKSIKNLDYWFTYSYLDTKRKYLNYPYQLRPSFTTPHTFSVAVKEFIPDLSLAVNMSYSLATGRPYYDMREDISGGTIIYDNGTTKVNHSMNLHFAYLFTMFKNAKNKDFSGVGFGVYNLFGSKQVFGYNYSNNGMNKVPVTLPADRFYYVGFFMTLGIDRRNDLMDQNL